MPTGRIVLAAVLGGMTMFVWGAISHTLIPFSEDSLLGFTNEVAITEAIMAGAPSSGVYFLPWIPQRAEGMTDEQYTAQKEAAEQRMLNGPFMLASIRLGPMGSFGSYLVVQFITDIITALFVCLVLARTGAGTLFVGGQTSVLIGVAGFAAISLPQWNWYAFSWAFTTAELFDVVVGFFLGGLVIAKVAAMKKSPSTAA